MVNEKEAHLKMGIAVSEMKIADFKTLISRFTIPVDILDDIIYCQRSLRLYIRVHQILANRVPDKMKSKQLEEIERDICDIGREQNGLMARLRNTLEHYYMSIKNDNVEINREIGNAHVTRILSHHMDHAVVIPKLVKKRLSEPLLLSYYGLHDLRRKFELCKNLNTNSLKQESLLKPKSERFAQQRVNAHVYSYAKNDTKSENDSNLLTASPSINSSRLNLLQALNKARNQSLHVGAVPSCSPVSVEVKETIEISSSQSSSSSSSSSSDDSLDVPLVSPLYSEDEAEISQELFLRKFGLYTLEYSNHLKTKRSQRRRRNVQSNEKSDYHYGKLEMFERMNTRKKTYLHSPPATRASKRKRLDKNSEASSKSSSTDRSSSSSPDQKLKCSECNKGDNLKKCDTCPNWYHIKCQKIAPKLIGKKICPDCYMKLKEAKYATRMKESRYSRETKDLKHDRELKEIGAKITKNLKCELDLGIAPLENDS